MSAPGCATSPPAAALASAAPALVKIAALLATGLAVHLSLSPPNPPAPPKLRLAAARKTFFERAVRWVTFCSKMMVWTGTLLDVLATTALAFPALPAAPRLAALLCPAPAAPLLAASPLLLLGALAALAGAALRLACFRALGPLFTFELAITPSHALVTSGPYAWVRHPSYTGVYLTLLGASAVALAPGAWLRECALRLAPCAAALPASAQALPALACGVGAGGALAWLVLAFWAAKVAYALQSTHRRLRTEDTELCNAFGAVWDEYAERTRWRLLPGVF